MSKEIYISSTPQETRLAIVEKDELAEIYYERENEYTLAGSIYNGRVTRVLPGMQSAFVDIGLERDAFLYITDFMEEQGDSADFEAESSRNGAWRATANVAEGRERSEGRRRERPAAQATATEEAPITLQGESESSDAGEETGDGSRRWRGRRGRRRGRGENGDSAEGGPSAEAGSENGDVEAREPREPREPREFDRGSERPRRGDRDRGRQDAVRERFAPRGHRHSSEKNLLISMHRQSRSFCRANRSRSIVVARSAERKAREPRADSASASKPSTEFELTGAWDGGLTLPGETLSRHRGGERSDNKGTEHKEFEAAESYGSGSARGRDRRRERDERSGRPGRGRDRSLSPEEAVLPAVTSQHEPEPAPQPFSDDVPAFEVAETEARLELERFAAEDVAYTASTDVAPAEEAPSESRPRGC